MKRFIVGLLFAALAGGGLVAATVTSANADPYPGTVQTTVTIKNKKKVPAGKRIKIKATVSAAGNARPTGKVKFVVKRVGGGAKYKKTVTYSGGTVKFKTPRLKKSGRYKVKVKYKPTPGSVYAKSSAKSKFKVKRRR